MQNQQNTKMKIEIILMDSNEQLDRVNTDINNINEQIGNFDVLKLKVGICFWNQWRAQGEKNKG